MTNPFDQPKYELDFSKFEWSQHQRAVHPIKPLLEDAVCQYIMADSMAWDGRTLEPEPVISLSKEEIEELTQQAETFDRGNRRLSELDRAAFPLQTSSKTLNKVRSALHSGPGFVVLRGLVPQTLNKRSNMAVFAGVAMHVAERCGKQAASKYVVHIKQVTNTTSALRRVAPYSNRYLPFHTDQSDVVAMYTLCGANEGGMGTFASVAQICRGLLQQAPDLLEVLLAPDWPFDTPNQPEKIARRPLLYFDAGYAEMNFSRGALTKSPSSNRSPSLPDMTAQQCEALEWVHWLADAGAYRVQYQDGDIIFFNNRRILHGRDAFEDNSVNMGSSRHLLRLWLKDEANAGPAPGPLQGIWAQIFPEEETSELDDASWPLDPITDERDAIPKRFLKQ